MPFEQANQGRHLVKLGRLRSSRMTTNVSYKREKNLRIFTENPTEVDAAVCKVKSPPKTRVAFHVVNRKDGLVSLVQQRAVQFAFSVQLL